LPHKEAEPSLAISEADQRQVQELYQKIQKSRARLVGPDGKTQNLPVSLYEFLVKLIGDLCEGQSVAIVQNDAQLTTVEGARMLGVSRQFLIKLLERGDIPHHMVGTHRRIYVRDLLAYKAKRDGRRNEFLNELSRKEQEDGLYELADLEEMPDLPEVLSAVGDVCSPSANKTRITRTIETMSSKERPRSVGAG